MITKPKTAVKLAKKIWARILCGASNQTIMEIVVCKAGTRLFSVDVLQDSDSVYSCNSFSAGSRTIHSIGRVTRTYDVVVLTPPVAEKPRETE